MKKLMFLFVLAAAFSCSSIKVAYDYDNQADFTKYKTYVIADDNMKELVGELNHARLITAVETEMGLKGFTKSDNPDLIVDLNITSKKRVEANASTTGGYGGRFGYRGYGYGGGFSSTTVDVNEYTDGTLIITFVDKAENKIVWQGTGTKTLDETSTPEKREASINYGVKQIFTKYPPVKK